jgi:hypothetical protein
MKGSLRDPEDRFAIDAAVVLAAILLILPSSTSVLCIAPGQHIAIEDINALCCFSSGISLSSGTQPGSGFSEPGSCHNCTDLFLASNGRGVPAQSGNLIIASLFDAECVEIYLPEDISLLLYGSSSIGSTTTPIPVCSSVPLRC